MKSGQNSIPINGQPFETIESLILLGRGPVAKLNFWPLWGITPNRQILLLSLLTKQAPIVLHTLIDGLYDQF